MYQSYYLTDKGVSELIANRKIVLQKLYVFETAKVDADTLTKLLEMNNFSEGQIIVPGKICTSCETQTGKYLWCDTKNNQYESLQLVNYLMSNYKIIYLTNPIHSTSKSIY